jgi:hypothetical protein
VRVSATALPGALICFIERTLSPRPRIPVVALRRRHGSDQHP